MSNHYTKAASTPLLKRPVNRLTPIAAANGSKTIAQQVRPSQIHDPDFVRAVFELTYRISRQLHVRPCEWKDFILFLSSYVEIMGVDPLALEHVADLETLEPPDEPPELDTDIVTQEEYALFEERLYYWFKTTLSRGPGHRRPYVHSKTRPWFRTVAIVLKAAFPDVVRARPRWNTPRQHKAWKAVKAAWSEEKKWLAGRNET